MVLSRLILFVLCFLFKFPPEHCEVVSQSWESFFCMLSDRRSWFNDDLCMINILIHDEASKREEPSVVWRTWESRKKLKLDERRRTARERAKQLTWNLKNVKVHKGMSRHQSVMRKNFSKDQSIGLFFFPAVPVLSLPLRAFLILWYQRDDGKPEREDVWSSISLHRLLMCRTFLPLIFAKWIESCSASSPQNNQLLDQLSE